jgi:hypothetical protein
MTTRFYFGVRTVVELRIRGHRCHRKARQAGDRERRDSERPEHQPAKNIALSSQSRQNVLVSAHRCASWDLLQSWGSTIRSKRLTTA